MTSARRVGLAFALGAIVLIVGLAAFASPFASTQPDGLNKVAADHGFDSTAKPSAVDDGPLAGYAVKDIRDEKVSKGVSGVVGVAITLLVAGALFGGLRLFVRRRDRAGSADTAPPPSRRVAV